MNKKTANTRGWWLGIAASFCMVLFIAALLVQSDAWGQARDKHDLIESIRFYWITFLMCWVALCFLLNHASKLNDQPFDLGVVCFILLFALLARFQVVYETRPVLSDDIWRYIHDGAMLGQGTNPYLHVPADLQPYEQPVRGVVSRMNNPGLITIYQPTSQYVFAALDRLWQWSPSAWQRLDPSHDKVFRFGFVLFDLAIVVLLLWQLRQMGRSAWWAAAYAWHPLSISEVAGSGHQDVIGIALLLLTLVLAGRLGGGRDGERQAQERDAYKPLAASRARVIAIGAGVAFGLALGVKPVVLPIALVLAWTLRRRPKMVALSAGATLLTGAAIYLPFVLMDGGLTGMFDTARTFIDKWTFNSSAYGLAVRWVVDKPWVDYLAMACLLTVIVVSLARSKGDAARSAGAFLFASLLVSSTVHPWYLLWALALLPLYFSLPMWVLSLTIAASYAAHLNEGYRVPGWVVISEYVPAYSLLAIGLVAWFWRLKLRTPE